LVGDPYVGGSLSGTYGDNTEAVSNQAQPDPFGRSHPNNLQWTNGAEEHFVATPRHPQEATETNSQSSGLVIRDPRSSTIPHEGPAAGVDAPRLWSSARPKRKRRFVKKHELDQLSTAYDRDPQPEPYIFYQLAEQLGDDWSARDVMIWFNNHRNRLKNKEVSKLRAVQPGGPASLHAKSPEPHRRRWRHPRPWELALLEDAYKVKTTPTMVTCEELLERLGNEWSLTKVRNWFRNRRAKEHHSTGRTNVFAQSRSREHSPKPYRYNASKVERELLENVYKKESNPTGVKCKDLADQLGDEWSSERVNNWFKHRRAKERGYKGKTNVSAQLVVNPGGPASPLADTVPRSPMVGSLTHGTGR
ncbi:hypothetical protein CXG81DRAFT_21556, partial [Caulochytrium protostelioides]